MPRARFGDEGDRPDVRRCRREPKAPLQFAKYNYTAAAKINLKRIAKDLVESCVVEDASKLRRDFPFSFIALPWESSLND